MPYPSLEQYNLALQHPKYALKDPNLQRGKIAVNGLGLPLALCGGFALTYTLLVDGRKYAIRCFHKKADDIQTRYSAIASRIDQLNSPYFIDFDFLPSGVVVESVTYPIVKMAWADGMTMGEFLEDNYKDRNKLEALSTSLSNLSIFLERNQLSHGDIQPGNVMVSKEGHQVQLIDYDGMYVETIQSLGSSETGHRNFQHPLRDKSCWNSTLDRFSFIALNLALRSLQEDPQLWQKTQSDGDTVLFRSNDYADPDHSQVFQSISKYQKLTEDTKNFSTICKTQFNKIPTLSEFLQKRNLPQPAISLSTSAVPIRKYSSPFDVLDASNYELCKKHVGDRVELIGKITEIWASTTQYSEKPYMFLNFGDWHSEIVKIAIWPEGLERLSNKPNTSWQDTWVSVTGLLDPPYLSKRNRYSISISITHQSQIHQISESEANFRLGRSSDQVKREVATTSFDSTTFNARIVENLKKQSPTKIPPSPPNSSGSKSWNVPKTQSPASRNQAIISEMKKQAPQSSGFSQPQQRPSIQSPKTSPVPPVYHHVPKNRKRDYTWWFIGAAIIFALVVCSLISSQP